MSIPISKMIVAMICCGDAAEPENYGAVDIAAKLDRIRPVAIAASL